MISASTRYVLFALVMVGLLACSSTQRAAVFSHSPKSASKTYPKNPYTITVKSGEQLDTIAERYHVTTQELITLNRLKTPYHLTKGTLLRLPSPQYHIVQKGDTLFGIARGYGVDMNQLVTVNNIQDPERILSGSKLLFTASAEEKNGTLTSSNTLTASSSTANVTVDELAPLPAAAAVTSITPEVTSGTPASTPTTEISTASTDTSSVPVTDAPLAAAAASSISSTASLVADPVPDATPAPTVTAPVDQALTPVTTGAENFIWPVQGKIISRFGPRKGGLYNDGINISAPAGSAIKAASDGTVVYSGNELRGYGNLLLIKHDNGYITAYAHTAKNTVIKDAVVHKGDVIAYVGQTGHVSSPQLHFSIRRDRKALNPEKYLPLLLSKN